MQIARKEKKYLPRGPCAKACTELTSPVRVSEVPKIHRRKVVEISTMFQTFIMPFFSCIMTEGRKAVPLSQGSREAFSTESQPQDPPHPSTLYAQAMPSITPVLWNSQVISVQRRVVWIQASPGWRVISDAMAKAKGTVKPT